MPNLAQLLAGGTVAPMRSSIPVISSVSWTSFMTGRNPGKHGVYGFTDVKPGTFTMFFPNFGNVRSDTLWDVAGRAGKRSIVLNVPNTYPARPLEGLLVSGFVAVNLERAVFPPSLLPRLQAENYRIDVDYLNADQRLLALKAEKPKGLADVDPATKVFTLDPGRIYVHRQGRFPLGAVGSTEADDLLGRVREGLLALRDDRPGRAGDGRPVPRIFARDEIYRG